MDETGWRIAGWAAWLWVATTTSYTAYNVAWGRRFADATDLVPEDYHGTIVRDGYVVYRSYTRATHQSCAAHLLRRCGEMIEVDHPQGQATPRQVKALLTDALAARELPEAERAVEAERIGAALDAVIDRPTHCDPDRRLVKHLAAERHALLSFLADPDVDATNWRGEQAIRPAVVNRKVFGGNRTENGAATQSRMMTFFRTATPARRRPGRRPRRPRPSTRPAHHHRTRPHLNKPRRPHHPTPGRHPRSPTPTYYHATKNRYPVTPAGPTD